jgi:autophagy-related protein 27
MRSAPTVQEVGSRTQFPDLGGFKPGFLTNHATTVCGIRRLLKEDDKVDTVQDVIAIAGSLENHGGSAFDYEATRLKTSDSNSDSQKEGLRLVLKGGKFPLDGAVKDRREQKAVIEFLCDPEKTGLEGEWSSEDRYEGDDKNRVRRADGDEEKKDGEEKDGEGKDKDEDEDDDGGEPSTEHQLKKDDTSLIWESYGGDDKGADVLRLTWHTKYACEKRDDNDGDDDSGNKGSGGWGFFTWFIIM